MTDMQLEAITDRAVQACRLHCCLLSPSNKASISTLTAAHVSTAGMHMLSHKHHGQGSELSHLS